MQRSIHEARDETSENALARSRVGGELHVVVRAETGDEQLRGSPALPLAHWSDAGVHADLLGRGGPKQDAAAAVLHVHAQQ